MSNDLIRNRRHPWKNRALPRWALLVALALSGVLEHAARANVQAATLRTPRVVRSGDPRWMEIALTFDDGPHPRYTPLILDILARYDVKATFFVLGRHAEQYPELARRIVAEGHSVGNHGYSHHALKTASRATIRQEISRGQTAIERSTGEMPTLFRPPYGLYRRAVVVETQKAGSRLIEWSLSPKDWSGPKEEVLVARVLRKVRNGSIILLHDSDPFKEGRRRDRTVNALPALIEALQKRGYHLVTVPELLGSPLSASEEAQPLIAGVASPTATIQ